MAAEEETVAKMGTRVKERGENENSCVNIRASKAWSEWTQASKPRNENSIQQKFTTWLLCKTGKKTLWNNVTFVSIAVSCVFHHTNVVCDFICCCCWCKNDVATAVNAIHSIHLTLVRALCSRWLVLCFYVCLFVCLLVNVSTIRLVRFHVRSLAWNLLLPRIQNNKHQVVERQSSLSFSGWNKLDTLCRFWLPLETPFRYTRSFQRNDVHGGLLGVRLCHKFNWLFIFFLLLSTNLHTRTSIHPHIERHKCCCFDACCSSRFRIVISSVATGCTRKDFFSCISTVFFFIYLFRRMTTGIFQANMSQQKYRSRDDGVNKLTTFWWSSFNLTISTNLMNCMIRTHFSLTTLGDFSIHKWQNRSVSSLQVRSFILDISCYPGISCSLFQLGTSLVIQLKTVSLQFVQFYLYVLYRCHPHFNGHCLVKFNSNNISAEPDDTKLSKFESIVYA